MKHERFHVAEDGTRIWYGWSDGPGVPIVLCDGIGCDGFIWPYVIDHFRDTHTIVRWHYRGHGRSEVPTDLTRLSLQDLVRDLVGILDELGHQQVVLAGHSMGVQVILETMRDHADRVCALVPMCGSYGRPADTFHGTNLYRPVFENAIKLARTAPNVFTAVWRRLLPSRLALQVARFTELNRELVKKVDFMPYLDHLSGMRADIFFRILEFAIDHTTEDILEDIDVPTLIVAGDKDKFTHCDLSREMAERVPNAELVCFAEGTHTVPIEYPNEVEEALFAFLERHGLVAAPTTPSAKCDEAPSTAEPAEPAPDASDEPEAANALSPEDARGRAAVPAG